MPCVADYRMGAPPEFSEPWYQNDPNLHSEGQDTLVGPFASLNWIESSHSQGFSRTGTRL